MKKVWRIGIIGCKGIAYNHLRGILKSSDLIPGAFCDISTKYMQDMSDRFGLRDIPFFNDYHEMMQSKIVDAVTICTPNYLHFEMVKAAIDNNLPYSVEKPICNTAEQAAELMKLTNETALVNMVCFSYRFKAGIRYIKQIVESGALGRIYHINSSYQQAWALPGALDGEDAPLIWRFRRVLSGSGALGDLGSHLFDLHRFITNRDFSYIICDADTFVKKRSLPDNPEQQGDVDVDDYISIIGQMDDQLAVNLFISRYTYGRGNHQHIEIYGEHGSLIYDTEEPAGESLKVNIGNWPMRHHHVWAEIDIPEEKASDQMQSFADLLNGRGDGLAATVIDGYKNQLLLDNAILSFEKGKKIHIKHSF